ncbi:hypothetical protein [Embleya sp. NBC_00896]|uniref:hypothetical protein n=1 Tax=Embleya sp. NBC_00896 TaxID=2975961 RepID=UPI00386FD8BA|nr:hypothetical protein OG928_20100 [Embleya sp. NBC_00896]
MAKLNETWTIVDTGMREFGAKVAKKLFGQKAAPPSVGEAVGTAMNGLSVGPQQRMAEVRRQGAATHNQRRFPPESAAKLGEGVDSAKLVLPGRELSVAEVAQAMREELQEDARRRRAGLREKPAPQAAAARPVSLVKEGRAATSARAPADSKSLAKSAAAGFAPAAGRGASGRSSAAVAVNRSGPAPGVGVSRDSAGRELKSSLEK